MTPTPEAKVAVLLSSDLPELLRRALWLLTEGADAGALRLFEVWRTQRAPQTRPPSSFALGLFVHCDLDGCHTDPRVTDKMRLMLEAAFMLANVFPPREAPYRAWRRALDL